MQSSSMATTASRSSGLMGKHIGQRSVLRPRTQRASIAPAALFGGRKAPSKRKVLETVVPEPSFAVPAGLAAIAGFAAYEQATPVAVLAGILAAFLALQATRVKFVFDDEGLEVVVAGKEDDGTENAFVGGRNRWAYDTFVNWEFWWPAFPVLVYFKETQTKPEGQIHFFPIIFNGKQLYEVMSERCGTSQNSGPN